MIPKEDVGPLLGSDLSLGELICFSQLPCAICRMGVTVPAMRSCWGQVHSGMGSSNSDAVIAHNLIKGPCVLGTKWCIVPAVWHWQSWTG